jgi:hypothetical protein
MEGAMMIFWLDYISQEKKSDLARDVVSWISRGFVKNEWASHQL